MLVHIPTMGVIDEIYTGQSYRKNNGIFAKLYPVYKKISFKNYTPENPDEWQEVSNNTVLAKKLKRLYPEAIPVFDDNGILIDVLDKKTEQKRIAREKIHEAKKQDALSRGYKNRVNLRPKNLATFLDDDD